MTQASLLCPQCTSTVADGEEFCPVCGDFLGWRGELVTTDLVVPDLPSSPAAPPPELQADPLVRHRQVSADAEERAASAQAAAVQAQVRLERTRRRSASARRRLARLEAELPAAETRVQEAVAAVERAEEGARRATSAANAAKGRPGPRRDELRARARSAGRAVQQARAASRQAQEAQSTLSGVLAGVRAEVASAPAATSAAQRARDAARAEAAAAVAGAAAAVAELSLQERLLRLRATPRRVVALDDGAEQRLREQARVEADEAAREAERRAEVAGRRQLRRAEREDERRDAAEQQSDDRELGEVLAGATQAERAARTAERAGGALEPDATVVLALDTPESDAAPVQRPRQPGALPPSEVRRRVRRPAAAASAVEDGPVPCPSCAVGNAVDRRLCRVCGTVLHLVLAPLPPRPRRSWWRRLLRLGPAPVVPFVPAGSRPVPGGNRRTAAAVRRAQVGGAGALRGGRRLPAAAVAALLVLALALLVVLSPLGAALRDLFADGREQVREVTLVDTAVVPLASRASSTGRTSAPALALDGDPATSWTPAQSPGSGARLGLSLPTPTDLVAVRLTAAAGTGRPRPASVTVHSTGNAPVVLRLQDTLEPQRLPLDLRGVSDVRIRLDDLYPGRAPGLSAGFAEVVLLTRGPRDGG